MQFDIDNTNINMRYKFLKAQDQLVLIFEKITFRLLHIKTRKYKLIMKQTDTDWNALTVCNPMVNIVHNGYRKQKVN